MEAGKLFEFPLRLVRDIESRRVLALGGSDSLRHVLGGGLQTVKDMGFARGCEIAGHRLGGARWREVLENIR